MGLGAPPTSDPAGARGGQPRNRGAGLEPAGPEESPWCPPVRARSPNLPRALLPSPKTGAQRSGANSPEGRGPDGADTRSPRREKRQRPGPAPTRPLPAQRQRSAPGAAPACPMELGGAATLALAAGVSCLVLLWAWTRPGRSRLLPPGPTPLPLLGNALRLLRGDLFTSLMALREQYGPVFSVSLGPRRVVVLCGHEAVKEALVDHAEAFGSRGQMPTLDRIFQGYGLLLANGVRWKQLRHFSIAALRDLGMGKRLLEERVAAEAQALVEEIGETKGSPFEPGRPVSLAVGNVVASLAFGQRFDPQDQAFLALLDAIRGLFRELSSPWTQLYEMFSGLLRFLPGPHNRILVHVGVLHDFVTGRMRRNQETLDPSCPRDYIDAFLIKMEEEKQNPHSEFHARNLTLSTVHLFFGGTEMVSATLRYGFLLLAKHPEVQGKVHEEIERVVGRDRSPAAEDRSRMPYTQAVIHEVQRFCYVLPLGIPHAVSRDTQFRGYTLPKGTDVLCALGSALRDPGHFRDPERFNPGNFLGEDGRFQKNPAFMAFSAGKRICLGEGLARLELFLFLTTVLQRFALTWPGDPQEIDLTPQGSGFWNLPPEYQICAVPR
ncbi:cytochrome P450 2G1-like isoform X1 [Pelodiscus sinensis]|uniref:cytochrome P450 2G1-like isoform X1 n=1 Tax=Pelodiscus sinensis TaxID=13735 RepID=UPI003F6C33C6